jgi:integration host factor subunit beta
MTKADLIDEVSRLAELTRKDSEVIVETIFDSIVRSLRVGDRVEVPAKKIPFFKPSKELKDLVNTGDHAAPPPAPPAP